MHYFQFNIGDYHSHTLHLTPMQDLSFRRMMDWCYLHEKPLPEDVEQIARIVRLPDECNCIAFVLDEFFNLTSKGWEQKRIKKEIKKYNSVSGKRSKAATTRWENERKSKKNNKLSDDANALQVQCTSNAKQEPITKNHKPINNKQETSKNNVSLADQKNNFEELWKTWPSGFGEKGSKKNALSAYQKIKPDDKLHKHMLASLDLQHQDKLKKTASGTFCPDFPHVERWLRNRRFEDEIIIEKPVGRTALPADYGDY